MISCIRWIPKGIANPDPIRYDVISEEMLEEKNNTIETNEKETLPTTPISELPPELKMDEYSSEEDNIGSIILGKEGKEGNNSDDDDDLIDVPDTREYLPVDVEGLTSMNIGGAMEIESDGEGDNSDEEDLKLTEDDALLLVSKTEEDFASLEVRVYDSINCSLYVHHDISLPSYPLCLAHGDYLNERDGNYCAVGTFDPSIEIWNLDVINPLEPTCILGGYKDKELQSLHSGSHADAVMSLSWNTIHRQMLASASADTTVKLWDINSKLSSPVTTFTHHKDKVQCLAWHPTETAMLSSGSYDRSVFLLDVRSDTNCKKLCKQSSDCEAIAWDPFSTHLLTVVAEDGLMSSYDIRHHKKPYWSIQAKEMGGVSDICYNSQIPGMLASSSIDNSITIWDSTNIAQQPTATFSVSKDMNVGKLFTVSFYPSLSWLLACGGSGNAVALWHLDSDDTIINQFSSRSDSNLPQKEDVQPHPILNTTPQEQQDSLKKKKKLGKKKKKKKVHKAKS